MRVAVLGLGSSGRRHAANLLALGAEVVGFDPQAEPPAGVRAEASAEAAIEAAAAVVVSSPTAFHARHAVAALERGRPTLVDKPLAATESDGERIARAAEAASATCAVGMNLRFHPGVLELRRLVTTAELGELRVAEAWFGYDLRRWRPGTDYRASYSARAELGGGIVLDAIHELDYLMWLFGPVESVSAETATLSDLEVDVEDTALAVLRFAAGPMATVALDFHSPVYRRGCVLVGSAGVARWSWEEEHVVVRGSEGEERRLDVPAGPAPTYAALVEDFVRAADLGGSPRCPVGEGLATLRVAEAIKRAAATGRRVSPTART